MLRARPSSNDQPGPLEGWQHRRFLEEPGPPIPDALAHPRLPTEAGGSGREAQLAAWRCRSRFPVTPARGMTVRHAVDGEIKLTGPER